MFALTQCTFRRHSLADILINSQHAMFAIFHQHGHGVYLYIHQSPVLSSPLGNFVDTLLLQPAQPIIYFVFAETCRIKEVVNPLTDGFPAQVSEQFLKRWIHEFKPSVRPSHSDCQRAVCD